MECIEARVLYRPPDAEHRYLPECPLRLPTGELAFVVIQHGEGSNTGSVGRMSPTGGAVRIWPVPGRPGFIAGTDDPARLLIGLDRGFSVLDLGSGRVQTTGVRIDEDASTLINDGIATPFGVVFGTKDPEFRRPIAGLWMWRRGERQFVRLREGQVCSNGKAVVREGDDWVLLDIDSATRRIVRYRLDVTAGRVEDAGVVADFSGDRSIPDGLRLVPGGKSVIVAFVDFGDPAAGEAREIDLGTGRTLRRYLTPGSPQVTCPEFIEAGGRVQVLLATAAEHMKPDRRTRHPEAGSFFVAETTVRGPLPHHEIVPLAALCG